MAGHHYLKYNSHLLWVFLSLHVSTKMNGQSVEPWALQLDTALERIVKESGEAGLALAVVKGNNVLYAQGFGYRDVARHLPVTPQTVFPIASCTKAFTATLIGSLGDKLSLDVPLSRYLPDLRFATPELNEQTTARDLLCL